MSLQGASWLEITAKDASWLSSEGERGKAKTCSSSSTSCARRGKLTFSSTVRQAVREPNKSKVSGDGLDRRKSIKQSS